MVERLEHFKVCRSCKENKSSDFFSKDKFSKDGLWHTCKNCHKKNRRIYLETHKKETSERNKKWRQSNLEKARQSSKEWFKKNRKRMNELTRNWRENNKEKFKEMVNNWEKENIDKRTEQRKNWKLRNKDKIREINRNQRNKRRTIYKEGNVTTKWLLELKEKTKYCSLCGEKLNDIQYHPQQYNLEHIIPLKIGGKHSKDNIRFTCARCNHRRPKDGRDILIKELING